MELTLYEIIKKPIVSDKSSRLARENNKITFEVHQKANKAMVADAVEKLFNVKVATVRISVRKGKVRTFKRMQTKGKASKRAYVTLQPGYSLGEAGMAAEGRPSESTKGS